MAEIAGLVIGGISVAALVDGCMKTFDRIDSARTYGKDYGAASLKLSLLQLRLSRWAEGVLQTVQQEKLISIGTSADAKTVQDLLGEIATTIEDTERFAERYPNTEIETSFLGNEKEVAAMKMLSDRVKTMAIHRQKTSSIKQKTQWALRDQRKFKRLLASLSDSISDLEQLFPAEHMVILARTQQLAQGNASELIQPSEIEEPAESEVIVSILDEVTSDVDKTLQEALVRARMAQTARHSYGMMNVGDSVRIQIGDYIAPGQRSSGAGHMYGTLNATGTARVHYGDNFGGKSVFDD